MASVREKPLPCFKCGEQLSSAFDIIGKTLEQPNDAVMFHAYGQYGSTAFDPMDNSQIQINICDSCLLEHKDRVWHVRYQCQEAQELFSHPWDPQDENQEEVRHD